MRRRINRIRSNLLPSQHATINSVAQGLPPSQRHAFLLHVSRTLQISTQTGFAADPQVNGAIAQALAEVAA
jgi:hypothetical protein